MSSIKSKERKSLCEESMLVFVNILKLSSLSLARTLVTTSDNDNHPSVPKRKSKERKAVVDKGSKQRSKRSQKPEHSPASYVMQPTDKRAASAASSYHVVKERTAPVDGHFSDYIRRFHEKTEEDHQNAAVEHKASDYIKRFHEKNMNDLNNASMRRLNYVLPPPPHQVFK